MRAPTILAVLSFVALGTTGAQAAPQPDFRLPEINPRSPRAGDTVSPSDYRQQITVWYFGREW
jgi:hypothetical protein